MENFWDLHTAFVRECEKINRANNIDPHHFEMEWHHLLPQCLFGDQPVGAWLTLRQHAVASCLQTLAFRKICFCGWHKNFVPAWLWELTIEVTKNERQQWTSKAGLSAKEKGVGCVSASSEQLSEWARKIDRVAFGHRLKDLGLGIHAPGQQARGGARTFELGVGCHSLSKEELRENGRKTTSQKWKCLVTGHISTPGGLASFQKARNIDTSLRERVE
jgi:hypothetical protein